VQSGEGRENACTSAHAQRKRSTKLQGRRPWGRVSVEGSQTPVGMEYLL